MGHHSGAKQRPRFDVLLTPTGEVHILDMEHGSWNVTTSARSGGTFRNDCLRMDEHIIPFPESHWSQGRVIAYWTAADVPVWYDLERAREITGDHVPAWLSGYLGIA